MMGTPNITGKYSGPFRIGVRATKNGPLDSEKGKLQAFSGTQDDAITAAVSKLTWAWDFVNKTVTLEDGRLTPKEGLMPPANHFDFKARNKDNQDSNELSFEDNGDGTYTVEYHWQVFPNLPVDLPDANPSAKTTITLEISQLTDGSISVVTVPGPVDNIPGTPLPFPFPLGAAPDWRGRAEAS